MSRRTADDGGLIQVWIGFHKDVRCDLCGAVGVDVAQRDLYLCRECAERAWAEAREQT